jgi:hypothetical protein
MRHKQTAPFFYFFYFNISSTRVLLFVGARTPVAAVCGKYFLIDACGRGLVPEACVKIVMNVPSGGERSIRKQGLWG